MDKHLVLCRHPYFLWIKLYAWCFSTVEEHVRKKNCVALITVSHFTCLWVRTSIYHESSWVEMRGGPPHTRLSTPKQTWLPPFFKPILFPQVQSSFYALSISWFGCHCISCYCLTRLVYFSLRSEMSRSRISQAKMVGFSLLYCSILATTVGVATFGLLPPIIPGGLSDPAPKSTRWKEEKTQKQNQVSIFVLQFNMA